ncbi:MAG: hypothetical protein QOG48_1842 [Verrucomicrobiota bacterium]|jgi:hypothetical protein
MSTVAVPTIICSECQRENEAERVYCHDCGARLDRSAVITKKEPPVDVHKRVRKMFDPQRARLRAWFFQTSKMILAAGGVGLLVAMVLPADLPPPSKTEMLASQVRLDMESALQKHQPPQLEFSEGQMNAYLASALKTKKKALDKPFLDFKRAVVEFKDGKFIITTERSVSGYYSLYTTTAYAVAIANGKLVTTNKGGAIGRLQLHPALMQYLNILFSDVRSAVDQDAKLVARCGAVQFHDKRATFSIAAP